nr:hypothetical protein [Nocardia cyriacigeorgica]
MPLPSWLPDALLQHLAEENNLAETAFYTPELPAEGGPPPGDRPAIHQRGVTTRGEVVISGFHRRAARARARAGR